MNTFLRTFSKYMAVWVIAMSALAYFKPGIFLPLRSCMTGFFSLTMFGIGAVLKADDFREILSAPSMVVTGVLCQFTIMPVGAFLVARAFDLPPAIALGLILTGAAPGAMASNVMSYIARADVAYSVSLTSVSTLMTPVLTPALTYWLASSIIKVNFWAMFLGLIQMVILPLILGFLVRHFFRGAIERVKEIFPAISVTFIAFICALVIALNRTRLADITLLVLAAVVTLNLAGMLLGYGAGKAAGFNIRRRRTLSIEIGMQNAGLGTVLALKHFSPETAVPAAAFVFICIFTASIAAEIWRGMNPEKPAIQRI